MFASLTLSHEECCWSGTSSCGRGRATWPTQPPDTGAWCSSPARPASARPRSSTRSLRRRPARSARVAVGGATGRRRRRRSGRSLEMLPRLPDRGLAGGRRAAGVLRPAGGRASAARRAREPYLLVVEDAHWADEATLRPVRHLARRIHGCRALVLVTYRPEEATATHPLRIVVGDAATMTGTRRLDLPALTPERRPRAGRGARPGASRRRPGRRRRALPGHRRATRSSSPRRCRPARPQVPATVRDAVLSRTARLSPPARHVMDVVALAGARAEVDVLEAVLGDGMAALDEPLERGLLRIGRRRRGVPARAGPAGGRRAGAGVPPDLHPPADPRGAASRGDAGRGR